MVLSMIARLARFIKRFLILIPGIVVGYFAYHDLFPALDHWLPDELAIVATYILAAYLLIPLGVRLFHKIFQPNHLPFYSTTPDGLACDPLNVAVIGTRQQLVQAMKKAGWYQADGRTPHTILRLVLSIIFRRSYPQAPFSNLYLFGRKQDIGFQLPVDDDPSHRHHIRFWAASHTGDPRHLEHIGFWERFHKSDLVKERVLWVGAASLDTGLGVIRHNAQLTHMIDPDTDAERDLIVRQLERTGLVKRRRTVTIAKPYQLRNRVLTGYLHADGKLIICEL